MKAILLTQGKCAIVDNQDFNFINRWKWYFSGRYAVRGVWIDKKVKIVRMHRVLLNIPSNKECDHINGDKLDNRRSNLRVCTRSDNGKNRLI